MAFVPDATAPNGRRRLVASRTSALTRGGLDKFITKHLRAGHVIDVIEILGIDGVNG